MKNKKHGLAIVGFGGMAKWHTKLLKDFDNIEICGIYDIRESAYDEANERSLRGYHSLEALLSDPDVDIVLVATPNDFHMPIAIQAMEAGKNVISEKPVTLSSDNLQKMIDKANECGVIFTVHQNRRWDKDFRIAKKIFDEKKIGEVYQISSRVHGSRGIPGDWRGKKEHGGGMILDWGVHLFDQICKLIPGRIVKVWSSVNNITNKEVDDGFVSVLTFESGIRAIVEVGTSNYINLPRWYIEGDRGTAVIENFKCEGKMIISTKFAEPDAKPVETAAGLTKTMAPRTADSTAEYELPDAESDIHDFYKNVVAAVEGKEEQLIKHDELMRVMKLMEAVFRSAETGSVVDFE